MTLLKRLRQEEKKLINEVMVLESDFLRISTRLKNKKALLQNVRREIKRLEEDGR